MAHAVADNLAGVESPISENFQARLQSLPARARVRAIVLLQTGATGDGNRQSREERQAAIEKVRTAARAALGEIDEILKRHGGKRLGEPDALASIPVETTVDGLLALAASPRVRAILEDAPISSLQ